MGPSNYVPKAWGRRGRAWGSETRPPLDGTLVDFENGVSAGPWWVGGLGARPRAASRARGAESRVGGCAGAGDGPGGGDAGGKGTVGGGSPCNGGMLLFSVAAAPVAPGASVSNNWSSCQPTVTQAHAIVMRPSFGSSPGSPARVLPSWPPCSTRISGGGPYGKQPFMASMSTVSGAGTLRWTWIFIAS